MTFFSFKPCCDNLKKTLDDTFLSNPNYHETVEEKRLREQIVREYRELD